MTYKLWLTEEEAKASMFCATTGNSILIEH